ncbi:MAG: amylo-alpha-1,6-glucosidase [Bacteroidota bacterium]|nr:amylo-alpha-1,6-glucosidase [Bacteroidota bacterium]
MSIIFDRNITKNIDKSSELEWLETNGLGGWAGGTISGMGTRRYHGLLVAALHPPVGRNVLISKFSETIISPEGNYELDCNNFNGIIHPQGFNYLEKYEQDLFPVFHYQTGAIKFTKSIAMVHGENTTLITYEVTDAPSEFTMKLKPFISFKDYHWMSKANNDIKWAYGFADGTLKIAPYPYLPEVFIKVPGSEFHYSPDWYFNFMYKIELERGQDFKEDLFTYGEFYVKLKKGSKLGVIISTNNPENKNAFKLYEAQVKRKKSLLENTPKDEIVRILTLAADQFIVQRGKNLKTIIAGYHWFADWGRDTMISLPGLCLVTGRFDDAKKILKAFAEVVDKGMIPNRFPDEGETPEYNTVDATLWYFIAIYEYVKYSGDIEFVKKELYPVLKEIIDAHVKGTRYNIKVSEDGLLSAGLPGTQLTWMDAKVGDWVVTPREGKAVEINALWYNSLEVAAHFAKEFKNETDAIFFEEMAAKCKNSFNQQFVNSRGTLYDVLHEMFKDDSIRPNQLFAVSLPFELVNKEIAKSIVKETEQFLVTPKGLRSISNHDSKYIGDYHGDQLSRDGAYHQGTVWSWLIGPYISAKYKTEGKTSLPKIKKILSQFSEHFKEAGIGTVSEIFDGNAPYAPKGCVAQAWGVAEPLRVYYECVLNNEK